MARGSLERQVEVCALAYRVPVCVREDDGPPRELAVELRELSGIAAFQSDSAQLADTAHRLQPSRRPATAPPLGVSPVMACHVPAREDLCSFAVQVYG